MGQSTEQRESFVRWQQITITHLGYVIGLLLAIAIAMLGFTFGLVKDPAFYVGPCVKYVFSPALFLLTASIALGLICVMTRLHDFRETTAIARDREQWCREGRDAGDIDKLLKPRRDHSKTLGEWTWKLFWCQAGSFLLGALFLIMSLAIIYRAILF